MAATGRKYRGEDVELANAMKDLLLTMLPRLCGVLTTFHAPYGNDAKDSSGDALPKGKAIRYFTGLRLFLFTVRSVPDERSWTTF